MLRLISYSSADSFIKRDYILDIIESDKTNLKFLENHYQPLRYDHVSVKMSEKKTIFVQHRREYYNDFEDCLRDYRQQSQKTKSKQTKVHHSDGDNGESDSEYVDCTDAATCDLRHQSTLSSKSMPHVPTGNYHHETGNRSLFSITTKQQAQLSATNNELGSTQIKQAKSHTAYDSKSSFKDTQSNNNRNKNSNQVIDKRLVDTTKIDEKEKSKTFVNEKSMTIDGSSTAISLPKLYVNDLKKPSAVSIDLSDVAAAEKKDEAKEKKRKSCKKRQSSVRDTSQKKMTVTSSADNHKINNLEAASWSCEREVTLERVQNKSFGISIVGGKVNVSGDSLVSGIFIKNIIVGSAADKCGSLRVGDRILAVDGVDIRHSSHELAVKTIKSAGDRMTLCVQSLNTESTAENPIDFMKKKLPPPVTPAKTPIPEIIQEGIAGEQELEEMKDDLKPMKPLIRETPSPASRKSASNGVTTPENEDVLMVETNHSTGCSPVPDTESEGSSDDDEDTRDMEGRTFTAAGMEIDRASAGNVKRSKEEVDADPEKENLFGYTMNKIKKRYGNLGQVLCQTVDRGHSTNIGISLAGHRDRNKMACFVAGINPKGIASAGGLEIGDEILEVNGIVLHGRCHLNASAIIKGLPGTTMQFIVLRRKQALEDLAVKPVTQFPVEISNEDAFASFKNVRHVTIKKGNQSLGIMIIEGKHAEVGQGIFVSDIQEGSNAERAGLSVGDMILAVNKDSLLGCNYETAANMLKKTEGIVVLTVCNPNKKDELTKKDTEQPLEQLNKGASRPVTPKPQPSPAKEAVHDPVTCEINPNHNTVIEIKLENNPIGIQVAGGCDTLVNTGAVIVNVLPNSIAEKDKRLQVFDQILEINSTKVTTELTCELIQRAVKQVQSKVKMTIYRADPAEVETLEIELPKKPGKNLGIGFFTANPRGLLVTDIVAGGIADLDGRIQKSDIVTHVNSEKISNMGVDDCSALLKAIQGKIVFKVLRAKPKKRSS